MSILDGQGQGVIGRVFLANLGLQNWIVLLTSDYPRSHWPCQIDNEFTTLAPGMVNPRPALVAPDRAVDEHPIKFLGHCYPSHCRQVTQPTPLLVKKLFFVVGPFWNASVEAHPKHLLQ